MHQSAEKIAIPDTEYDRDFWRDVDDEGVGGHSRYLTTKPPEKGRALLCVPFDEITREEDH